MNDIPEVALRTIEDIFGTSFVRHAGGEADAGQLFASVFPENAAQVESLTKLAARYRIPLIARGASTALNSGRAPRALAVRFDAMREIRIPESGEDWVEVEPGVTWMVLEERLRENVIGSTLAELERELVGVAIQGSVARMGEVALLAFDPAKGSAGLVDLSATSDIELVRLAGRSWLPERR
jgi:hypothetical protein